MYRVLSQRLVSGAIAGALFVALLWMFLQSVLFWATNCPPLSGDECFAYFKSAALPGAVLGAATTRAWKFHRMGEQRKAASLLFGSGASIVLVFLAWALWRGFQFQNQPAQINLRALHTRLHGLLPLSRWQFEIFVLFKSKNLPFLLAAVFTLFGFFWLLRQGVGRDK